MTGLIYILTSLTLLIALVFVARDPGRANAYGETIFRYDSGRLKFFSALIPIPLLVDILVFFFGMGNEAGIKRFYPLFFGLVFSLCIFFAYIYFKSVAIKVDDNNLHISNMFTHRQIALSEIVEIFLIEGYHGLLTIVLRGNNSNLVKFGDSMQDIQGLCSLLRSKTRRFGTLFKYRDRWGKWYDRVH